MKDGRREKLYVLLLAFCHPLAIRLLSFCSSILLLAVLSFRRWRIYVFYSFVRGENRTRENNEEWQYFCVAHICMYINLNDPFCLKNGRMKWRILETRRYCHKGKKGRIGRIEEHLSWTYLCINLNDPFCSRWNRLFWKNILQLYKNIFATPNRNR